MAEPVKKVVRIENFVEATHKKKGKMAAGWKIPVGIIDSSSGVASSFISADSWVTDLELESAPSARPYSISSGEVSDKDFSTRVTFYGALRGRALSRSFASTVESEPLTTSRIVPINSLGKNGVSLKRPIHVEVLEEEDGVTASFSDVNLYGFGKTETAALNMLREQIVCLYEKVNSEEKLGPLPRQWKVILGELIEAK